MTTPARGCPVHADFDPLVDELLRFDPSVPVWRRVTTRPVSLGGVDLPAGAKLFLWLAAAGRDAEVFPEPDTFDPERGNARRTLASGAASTSASAPPSAASKRRSRSTNSPAVTRPSNSRRLTSSCRFTRTSPSAARRRCGCGRESRDVARPLARG
jgi:hypothetical protein